MQNESKQIAPLTPNSHYLGAFAPAQRVRAASQVVASQQVARSLLGRVRRPMHQHATAAGDQRCATVADGVASHKDVNCVTSSDIGCHFSARRR